MTLRQLTACFTAALLFACGGAPPPGGYTDVPTSTCASGVQWTAGNAGAPTMNPGQACIACHTSNGEGPTFQIAGTVYGDLTQADNCGGEKGVQVEITDRNGAVHLLTANGAGNFFFESRTPIALPYKAKLIYSGGERAMAAAQTDGDCNSCHTATGVNGAPGRIAVP